MLTEPPGSGYSLTSPFSSGLNPAPKPYVSMNMQAGRVRTAPAPAGASRRLYLPTIVIAGLAASLSYRGWTALAGTGVARSFDAGRYQLAGPVVLGFVLTVCVLEQIFPAQRRPLLARGHLLDFGYAVFYGVVMLLLTAALLWRRRA